MRVQILLTRFNCYNTVACKILSMNGTNCPGWPLTEVARALMDRFAHGVQAALNTVMIRIA